MKLSEAIREGAKIRQQGFGKLFDTDQEMNIICTCALGAAWEGAGNPYLYGCSTEGLKKQFPCLNDVVQSPDSLKTQPLLGIIINLNDDEKWTREQIANFVEKMGY